MFGTTTASFVEYLKFEVIVGFLLSTGLNQSPQALDVRFITIEASIKIIIISCKSFFKCVFILENEQKCHVHDTYMIKRF